MRDSRDSLASRVDTFACGSRVYVLKIRFNYCYVLINERTRQAVAVDPAWDGALIQGILSSEQAKLEGIIVTHSHFDHMHLAASFSHEHDCPVLMSREEVDFYRVDFRHVQLVQHASLIHLAGMSIQPLLTPGHTRGGTCLYINGCVFSGDTLFAEGCGMCVGAGADARMMYNSLRMLREVLPNTTRVYPGHSYGVAPGATMAELRETNVYLNIDRVAEFVRFRMRTGQRGLFDFR